MSLWARAKKSGKSTRISFRYSYLYGMKENEVTIYPLIDMSELNRCLLCHDAPCTKACVKSLPVGDILKSIYFRNAMGALEKARGEKCIGCDAPCEKACVLGRKSTPVMIKSIIGSLYTAAKDTVEYGIIGERELRDAFTAEKEPDISADIKGVKLESPFLLSSSVVASSYEMCAKAFKAGWAGAAFKTICSFPQHEASPRFSTVTNHSNSFCGFKNIEQLSDHSVEENMEVFRRLKRDFPEKVIIASIMGQDEKEWTSLAHECELAGADVIECNFSCPNMESDSLGVTIGQDAALIEKFTAAVRRGTALPVLAKMTPNITDMVPMAVAARRGGADGIAAINTINSITGVNIHTFTAEPDVHGHSIVGGYSGQAVKPIALRFISDMAHSEELRGMHLSGMGGIENWIDALEFISLGAGSVQVTTAVMQYGYRIIEDLLEGVRYYLKIKHFSSLRPVIGAAVGSIVPHNQLERDTILFPRFDYEKCIGCGRCYTSCYDGGHQAIEFDLLTRRPRLLGSRCVGCHLCRLVCPSKAIGVAAKRIERS